MKYFLLIGLILCLVIQCTDSNPAVIDSPNNKVDNNYFPLTVGSWWSYTYDYRPQSSDHFYHRQQGTLTWKISSIEGDMKYYIEETIQGIEMNWDQNYDIDTNIINTQQLIEFRSDDSGFITIDKNNHFGNILYMELNRFYQNKLDSIVLNYKYNNWDVKDESISILNTFQCGYQVKLLKNVGITEILIMNWSNSSPTGSFTLKDYKIE